MPDTDIPPFEVQPIPRTGWIGRLFGRASRKAILVEVRNILATTPFHEVTESAIAGAFAKGRLVCRDATRELKELFEHAALILAADRELGATDRRGLAALQRAFQLTDGEAAEAIESAVGQVYEQTMRDALADGTFTEEERRRLDATSQGLGMSEAQCQRLYEAAASAAVEAAFMSAVDDRRYSKNEEAYVNELARSLGISIRHDAEMARLVERFKLLAAIDDGDLPAVPVSILLKRGEDCHFAAPAGYHRIKTVTKRINYGGPSASIRIMKGVRWRVGSISVQRVTSEVMTQLDTGQLYLTNTRLLFDGGRKNTTISLRKVTNFTVFKDGMRIEKETGPDEYFLGEADWELAGACLEAAISKVR